MTVGVRHQEKSSTQKPTYLLAAYWPAKDVISGQSVRIFWAQGNVEAEVEGQLKWPLWLVGRGELSTWMAGRQASRDAEVEVKGQAQQLAWMISCSASGGLGRLAYSFPVVVGLEPKSRPKCKTCPSLASKHLLTNPPPPISRCMAEGG